MELKKVFESGENGTLTYDQFMEIANKEKAKFTDLSEGKYVSVNKYNDDLAAKDKEIETLNTTISTRDTDLEGLKKQLEEAGADANKLQELTTSFTDLQSKYDNDTKAYKEQMKKQAYEFAVKEYAAGKKFTSNAAKQYFIQSMIKEDLKMDKDGKILGADDYVTSFSKDNSDAFVSEEGGKDGNPGGDGTGGKDTPHFIDSTPGAGGSDKGGSSTGFNFNFTGVRPKPTE